MDNIKNTPPLFLTILSIKETLLAAKKVLLEVTDSPTLDAELLLAHCLGKNRTYLHTWPESELNKDTLDCFEALIKKRLTDYPVAYLLGRKPFWTLDLLVTPDVLIPRPETELLVEVALEKIESIKKPKILDLGTGSGAIALALATERPDATIIASDYSEKALDIAKENANRHELEKQLTFIQSDWFSHIKTSDFDLIVSNPPYISPNDPHLLESIRHEPLSALVAENSGMKDIEVITTKSPHFLRNEGWLIIEHGYDQSEATFESFEANRFSHIQHRKDLNGNSRLSYAQYIANA